MTFYYDHAHALGHQRRARARSSPLPGSFQTELGCPGDWAPDCLRAWLQDPDGDGTYTWSTTEIPAGHLRGQGRRTACRWDENYGAGGAPGGANIPFTVPAGSSGDVQLRARDARADRDDIERRAAARPRPGRRRTGSSAACSPGTCRPDADAAGRFRLHAAADGGLAVDDEAIVGGDVVPLTLDPAGLPADAARAVPAPRRRTSRCDCRATTPATSRSCSPGQLAVAAYDDLGRLVDATGVQIPGVLDDLYADAADARPRRHVARRHARRWPLWAPTAQGRRPARARGRARRPTRGSPMRRDADGVWSVTGRPRLERRQLPVRGRRLRARRRTRSRPTRSPTRTRSR